MALERMFSNVVHNYDILNHIITFGLDNGWRKKAAGQIENGKPLIVLDLGSGTGDMAFQIESYIQKESRVIALDFSKNMLKLANKKKRQTGSRVDLIAADVALLPVKTNSVDYITTSFSFRNLVYKNPDRNKFLDEIFRVLAPGGKFIIVESSQPSSPIFKKLFHFYSRRHVPFVGGLVSGDKGAYKYLGISMANFYDSDEIMHMLEKTGFRNLNHISLALGLAAIFVFEK
jgi:demethylmenaquinone methyltransferase/2-methoxy-6-polyprenyl-1,4-benzoquinol methylase